MFCQACGAAECGDTEIRRADAGGAECRGAYCDCAECGGASCVEADYSFYVVRVNCGGIDCAVAQIVV